MIEVGQAGVSNSLNPPGVGSITSGGLYMAPSAITSAQTLTVTATNPNDSTQTTSTTVALWPGLLTNLTPLAASPYPVGTSASFLAKVTDISGSAMGNVNLTFQANGANVWNGTGTTDSTGQATFSYTGTAMGSDVVKFTAGSGGAQVTSSPLDVGWSVPSAQAPMISVSANTSTTLPNPLVLTATVTDPAAPLGGPISIMWSQIGGPAPVTFSDPTQPTVTATFSQPGAYVLQITATDLFGTTAMQLSSPPITVNPKPPVTQGWISSPIDGSKISGAVPVTVVSVVTLASGTLSYSPASDTTQVNVLNANVAGSGQIGVFDTTLLPNGSYWVQLRATDTSGNTQNNIAFVTVIGDYKPGRVAATITDFTVPAKGLSIKIQRSYDSLNKNTVGDFGYGWSLSTLVDLEVDSRNNVTFTLGGRRRTFYFTPKLLIPSFGLMAFEPNLWLPAFTPEPGLHGTLVGSAPGCATGGIFFDILVENGSFFNCGSDSSSPPYNPPGYIYTDPTGTQYTMGSDGTLKSILDLSGNSLQITAAGITSTSGVSVPFVRDSQGRITQITDTLGNNYNYSYDDNGNLVAVALPGISTPSTYTYDPTHLVTSEIDRNGHSNISTYDANGRVASITDADGFTTQYTYDTSTNTNTVTNADTGKIVTVSDAYGDPLTVTDPLNRTILISA